MLIAHVDLQPGEYTSIINIEYISFINTYTRWKTDFRVNVDLQSEVYIRNCFQYFVL